MQQIFPTSQLSHMHTTIDDVCCFQKRWCCWRSTSKRKAKHFPKETLGEERALMADLCWVLPQRPGETAQKVGRKDCRIQRS